jgi:hypothetical protein
MLLANKPIAVLAALALVVAVAALAMAAGPSMVRNRASGEIPGLVSYQGYLTDTEGLPMEGPVDLTFGLYEAMSGGGAIWTETQAGVPLTEGYFHVLLGSVNPLSAADFADPERYLQVSVDDGGGVVDLPRQRLASVPYAMQAAGAPWAGLSDVPPGFADDVDGVEYDNVIVVAKSGGDFTSVQAAFDSISDANWDNRYLIWIGPGRYDEQVTLKSYVSLRGAGQWQTVIGYAGGSASEPPDTATLTLASNASVRQLRLLTTGTAAHNAAVLVPAGTLGTTISHVNAEAWGAGTTNYGMVVTGAETYVALEHVNAQAGNGTETNIGLLNTADANVTAADGSFRASGGDNGYAIVNRDGSELRAQDVTAEANGASVNNVALWNHDSARAELSGGLFRGRDGAGLACGICNDNSHTAAIAVQVAGSSNSVENYGLRNDDGTAELRGGDYGAGGGEGADTYAYAIWNNSSEVAFAPSLMARGAWAHVGGGDHCYAMYNEAGGNAMLVGGELWAAVCHSTHYGAYNTGSGSSLEVNNVLINAGGGYPPFYGLFAGEGTRTDISNSELRGGTYALRTEGGSGHLQFVHLNGLLMGDASQLECNAVTQGGAFYADSCPPVP